MLLSVIITPTTLIQYFFIRNSGKQLLTSLQQKFIKCLATPSTERLQLEPDDKYG
jgi:hypothetical protein